MNREHYDDQDKPITRTDQYSAHQDSTDQPPQLIPSSTARSRDEATERQRLTFAVVGGTVAGIARAITHHVLDAFTNKE